MAHVRVTSGDDPRVLRIFVDGVDFSGHVYRDGFGIVQVGEGDDAVWGVSLILAPDFLDVDLHHVVVQAQIQDREGSK